MVIDHTTVAVAKQRQPVSEDACHVLHESEFPFIASVVDAHGFLTPTKQRIASFAQFVANRLVEVVKHDVAWETISNNFDEIQRAVEDHFADQPIGAAAACLKIDSAHVLKFASAGDCRLVRYDPAHLDGLIRLTEDHTPDHPGEQERLKPYLAPQQFHVTRNGMFPPDFDFTKKRLHFFAEQVGWSQFSLSYTRGFGHPRFRPAFTHVPDVREVLLAPDDTSLFALCSDGGNKLVRHVFRRLQQQGLSASVDLQLLADMVHRRIAEKPKGWKHDVTIIFFKVSP